MATAFIPVRSGSKSIHKKNIKLFCGKPLLYWTLRALDRVSEVTKVVVATDSDEIARIAESFLFKKVEIYRRDPFNASDTASTESVMLEYLSSCDIDDDELFVLVQATSPLTEEKDFEEAFKHFRSVVSWIVVQRSTMIGINALQFITKRIKKIVSCV